MMYPTGKNKSAGVTLIEAVIAIAITVIAVVGIQQLYTRGFLGLDKIKVPNDTANAMAVIAKSLSCEETQKNVTCSGLVDVYDKNAGILISGTTGKRFGSTTFFGFCEDGALSLHIASDPGTVSIRGFLPLCKI